ncbi:LOW QUALITY PROTEIN: hypothetical protein CVT26_005778 [Gymnopilus dilepis]|uniref:Uncharacterized protein n=1 Tax=Gymnopilus dilepis TaxID=231916 RepID=A0A409VPH6_9AGAR|nr:LOW QUALITY PROTEIN: hypothetical protein CVT26_005778 [Gymnopilus dilepis]
MINPEYCSKRQPFFPTWPFGKKRRVVALSITLIASSCITFIIGASGLRVKPLSLHAATSPAPANVRSLAYGSIPQLIFAIEVITADPMSRTITMDWYPQLESRCRTSGSSEVMDIFVNPLSLLSSCIAITSALYLDSGSLDSSSPSFTSSPPYQPVFQYNRTMQCSQNDPLNASFRTVTKLLVSRPFATTAITPLASSSTLQNYPFDQYDFTIFDLVSQLIKHLDTRHNLSFTLLITTPELLFRSIYLTLLELLCMFIPRSHRRRHSPFEFRIKIDNHDVLRFSKFAALFFPDPATIESHENICSFDCCHQLFSLKFISCHQYRELIYFWRLIAATFLAVCASTVIYPSHAIYAELFVVPVGAVFALTSVRANLPGAPVGFDLYSILPVLVVTGLSLPNFGDPLSQISGERPFLKYP